MDAVDDHSMLVGDVIQISNLPPPNQEFRDKWFRVESVDAGGLITLSRPFHDKELTRPYDGTGGLAHLAAIGLTKPSLINT